MNRSMRPRGGVLSEKLMLQRVGEPVAKLVLAPSADANQRVVHGGIVVDPDDVARALNGQTFAQSTFAS